MGAKPVKSFSYLPRTDSSSRSFSLRALKVLTCLSTGAASSSRRAISAPDTGGLVHETGGESRASRFFIPSASFSSAAFFSNLSFSIGRLVRNSPSDGAGTDSMCTTAASCSTFTHPSS